MLGDFVPHTESRQNQIPASTTRPRWSGAHVTFLGSHDQDSAELLCQGCAGAVVTGCSHSPALFSGMKENRKLPFKILFPQLRKDKLNSICSSSHDPCVQEPKPLPITLSSTSTVTCTSSMSAWMSLQLQCYSSPVLTFSQIPCVVSPVEEPKLATSSHRLHHHHSSAHFHSQSLNLQHLPWALNTPSSSKTHDLGLLGSLQIDERLSRITGRPAAHRHQ